MNYGLYLSANGALTSMYRQDVITNNLANLQTVGFKPDLTVTRQRLPQRQEDPSAMADAKDMLERLGGGHLLEPTAPLLKQGTLSATANPLDLAIEGDGFFSVESPDAKTALLTRDGRFTMNSAGQLVMTASGKRVLDADGQAIQLDPAAPVTINPDGRVSQNNAIVARIGLVQPADPKQLAREGESLLSLDISRSGSIKTADGRVIQNSVELSAVDPILTLNAMISASKGAGANLKMMQYHDNAMSLAINTMGRVA